METLLAVKAAMYHRGFICSLIAPYSSAEFEFLGFDAKEFVILSFFNKTLRICSNKLVRDLSLKFC